MGAKKSKAGVDSSAILEKPWREIKWSDESGDLQWIKNYKPQTEGQQLRILLHGPCKAGKSSFINSVQNVLQASISELAPVNTAYYQKFTTYKMVNGPSNTFYPFVFNEMMGLKDDSNRVQVNDIKHALKGHVKDGYTFNPVGELTEDSPHYNESPTINDKVHILVCVIDASTDDTKNGNVIKTLRDIRAEASKLEIPQLAIFTKIDKAFPEIEKDVKNTYRSKRLREKMLRLRADVGIPMNCIFATQNCLTEKDLDSDINTLFLSTLRCIIHFGDDFLNSNIVK